MIKLGNKGETIVSVLVSVAAVSVVLVSSYVLARRSFVTGQVSRERTQVLKILETQLERLKYLVVSDDGSNPLGSPFNVSNPFCVDERIDIIDRSSTSASTVDACGDGVSDFSTLNSDREFDVIIEYDEDGNDSTSKYDDHQFKLTASWYGAGRLNQKSQIILYYRIHPVEIVEATPPTAIEQPLIGYDNLRRSPREI